MGLQLKYEIANSNANSDSLFGFKLSNKKQNKQARISDLLGKTHHEMVSNWKKKSVKKS